METKKKFQDIENMIKNNLNPLSENQLNVMETNKITLEELN